MTQSRTIEAIYENGVFRSLELLDGSAKSQLLYSLTLL
jgi:hypothetical protein